MLHVTPLSHAYLAFKVSSGKYRPKDGSEADLELDRAIVEFLEKYGRNKEEFWLKASEYPQVLEHVFVTVLLLNVPTFIMWQITRHRHISWMVSSHRHTLVPEEPAIPKSRRIDSRLEEAIRFIWNHGYRTYKQLIEEGYPKEVARLVLPPIDSRTILASGNLRAWLELICFRLNADSQEETKMLVEMIVNALNMVYGGLKKCFPQICKNLYKHRMPREEN